MNTQPSDLENRTKAFAVGIINFVSALPGGNTAHVIGGQLMRSGTSVGAIYREANRGVSRRDFINKIGIVVKEAAETQYWLELCLEVKIGNAEKCTALHREATELLAIFTSAMRTCTKTAQL